MNPSNNLKLAVIVPTKGRYDRLSTLFDSMECQSVKPDLVLIVDANEEDRRDMIASRSFPIQYIHTGPNSLTEARNVGIKAVARDFQLVCFFDDDLTLLDDAFRVMIDFWKNASSDIGGAAFNITYNKMSRRFWFLKRIYWMGDNRPGNVLASGYQTMLDNITEDVSAKWLPGGVTVWRQRVFDEFVFDENIKGYGYAEDLDFSYRVGKKYKLICLANARLFHLPHPVKGKDNFRFGFSEITNRFYFIRKHKEFSRGLFLWASLGRVLENMIFALLRFDSDYFNRAQGNLSGIKQISLKK